MPQEVRNLRVPAKSLRRLRKDTVEMDLEERMHLPGLDPRRADLMVAGAVLLDTLLKKLGADEITLCDLALREGVLLDYIHRHRRDIARVDKYPDVRRRSVIELAERCAWEADHSRQVAALALTMFDFTKRIHGLGDREREWLEYAGLLHDIGNHISYEKHHRHSYYLIKNGDLRGFEPEEIAIIALVTRYHRRATPSKEHEGMGELSGSQRKTVEVLVGVPAAGRNARSQPARRDSRHRDARAPRRDSHQASGGRRCGAGGVGGAPAGEGLGEALDRKIKIEKVPYRKGLKSVNTELTRQKLSRNPRHIG